MFQIAVDRRLLDGRTLDDGCILQGAVFAMVMIGVVTAGMAMPIEMRMSMITTGIDSQQGTNIQRIRRTCLGSFDGFGAISTAASDVDVIEGSQPLMQAAAATVHQSATAD